MLESSLQMPTAKLYVRDQRTSRNVKKREALSQEGWWVWLQRHCWFCRTSLIDNPRPEPAHLFARPAGLTSERIEVLGRISTWYAVDVQQRPRLPAKSMSVVRQ